MKKKYLIIILTSIFFKGFSQIKSFNIPIVNTSGGEGKNVVYKKPSKEQLENSIGWIINDCSQCLSNDCKIIASSTLAPEGSVNYSTKNLSDDNPMTAWVEGDIKYGIGDYIEARDVQLYSSLVIYNGYQKSPKSFIENSRVKLLKVTANGKDVSIIRLKDEMGGQFISIEDIGFNKISKENRLRSLRLTILDVYPGTKFKEVAISEIWEQACCVAGNSKINIGREGEKEIKDIQPEDKIELLDRNNKIIYASSVEIGHITHNEAIEIITKKGNSITVSPSHLMIISPNLEKIQARSLSIDDTLYIVDKMGEINTDVISQINKIKGPVTAYYFKNMHFENTKIEWPIRPIFNNIISTDEYIEKLNKKNE